MALPSFFKRKENKPTAVPVSDDAVAAARTGARRRLIGAAVLLAVGVIAFPLLFETQPRPIPVDLPIEIPRKEGVAPLPAPARPAKVGAAASNPAMSRPVPASAPALVPASPAVADPVPATVSAQVVGPGSSASNPKAKDADRAKALLEGKPAAPRALPAPSLSTSPSTSLPTPLPTPSAAASAAASDTRSARFVVQVGAFADVATTREARAKVEALGLKTYTQVVDTEGGKRTRVRVGPFETRDEALKVQNRLKAANLPGSVLTL